MKDIKKSLAVQFTESKPGANRLLISWAGQSGFLIKLPSGIQIGIDLYLSSCLTRMLPEDGIGYTRMMPAFFDAGEIVFDYIFVSHFHYDHLDIDCIGELCNHPQTKLYCPDTSISMAREYGVEEERMVPFNRGGLLEGETFSVKAIPADHGDMCSDAIGLLFDFGFTKMYFSGDTAYNKEILREVTKDAPDISILPINGAFGNMDEIQAARFAGEIRTKTVIPCHFWMCPYHLGSPGKFIRTAKEQYQDRFETMLLVPGELYELPQT